MVPTRLDLEAIRFDQKDEEEDDNEEKKSSP